MDEIQVARVPIVLALAAIGYFGILAAYRLTFHPLAKYPGPFWARITGWPEGISAWNLCRHTDLDRLHEQYGDIVRHAPNKLSFRSAQAWNDIYTDRHANVIKTGFTDATIAINHMVHTHSLSDRELHLARRKLLNHAFSESALRSLEPQILLKIREWCGSLSQPADGGMRKTLEKPTKQWGMKRNMGRWSSYLTNEVLSRVCFSQDNGAIKNGGCGWDDEIPGTLEFISRLYCLPIKNLLFPFVGKDSLYSINPFPGARANIDFRASATKCVTQRFALEESEKNYSEKQRSKDFFYYLLNGNNPETGTKFSPMELVGEALLLVVAGSDTSSTAMSATFFYLINNDRVLEKLKKEVRGAFEDVEEIKYYGSKLKDLVYLRACIEEAMRLSPPVPTLLERLVLPGGAEIDGNFVPEGISVGVPIYTLHHNPEYFERPHSYIPERWIEGSTPSETGFRSVVTEQQVDLARSAWVPFSSGLRGCVGRSLAYMELTMALARAIYLFDVRAASSEAILLQSRDAGNALDRASGIRRENKGEYQLNDVFVAQRDGPVVEFKSV